VILFNPRGSLDIAWRDPTVSFESGEDHLYPKDFFRPIALPQSIKRAVLAAA
jgi:hypothetical protein